jgi:hypothetical protein
MAEEKLWQRLDENTLVVPDEVEVWELGNANLSALDNLMTQGADVPGAGPAVSTPQPLLVCLSSHAAGRSHPDCTRLSESVTFKHQVQLL